MFLNRTTDKSFDSRNIYTKTSNVNIIGAGSYENRIDESQKIIPHITDFYPEGKFLLFLLFYKSLLK